jgi:hypothetical protein
MRNTMARFLSVAIGWMFFAACGSGGEPRSVGALPSAAVATAPSLGTAEAFSVVGAATVTNTGSTVLNRNLGVSPGTAVTGFPPGLLTPPATIHAGDAVAGQAQSDVGTAYGVLAGDPCSADLTGQNLGERTLMPGVYCLSSEALLSGTLVLDAQFVANSVFIFQIGSTLTTATGASVRVINGASACNVFWQVGSSATIGTNTSFTGDILALASVTLQTGATLNGRALARTGAVTLDDNQILSGVCPVTGADAGAPAPDAGAPAPDAGAPAPDAGAPAPDAGAPAPDAGNPGPPGNDAGVPMPGPDAGTPAPGPIAATCCFGAVECNGSCIDLKNDANNCGGCGVRCGADKRCSGGSCLPCAAAQTQCPDQCADLKSDPFNCGACGKVCAGSQSCVSGTCGECEGATCSNVCVELKTDPSNCGACGNVCAADQCCNDGTCSTEGKTGKSCKLH